MSSTSDTEDRASENDRAWKLGSFLRFRQYRDYPPDLAVYSLFVIFGLVAIVLLPANSNIRFLIAVPLLFFCPGYAIIALLYPKADSLPVGELDQTLSRAGLSFGLSLAVVPILILAIGVVGTLRAPEVIGGIGGTILLIAQLAAMRRVSVPKQRRYHVGVTTSLQQSYDMLTRRSLPAKFTLLLLIGGIILSTGAVGLTVSSPPDGYEFTQFYVGTEERNGNISTVEYPDELTNETSLTFVVENQEQMPEEYVVVVQLQRVSDAGVLSQSEELARYRNTVSQGGTWKQSHELSPELSGENLRLQYLLYRNDVPATPTKENSYRNVHIWVTSSPP